MSVVGMQSTLHAYPRKFSTQFLLPPLPPPPHSPTRCHQVVDIPNGHPVYTYAKRLGHVTFTANQRPV